MEVKKEITIPTNGGTHTAVSTPETEKVIAISEHAQSVLFEPVISSCALDTLYFFREPSDAINARRIEFWNERLMSSNGVPSNTSTSWIRSVHLSTATSLTTDKPIGFGRLGARVENTPLRLSSKNGFTSRT